MAVDIQIKDYTKKIQCGLLQANDTINFSGASAEDAGVYLRLDASGNMYMHKVPDQDTHWTDTDNTNIAVVGTVTPVSVTVDQELTPDDGSLYFTCRLDNTTNQDIVVTFQAQVDGVDGNDPQNVLMPKNETGRIVTFSGGIEATIAAGSVISVDISAGSTGVNVRGDVFVTTLRMNKAAGAIARLTEELLQPSQYALDLSKSAVAKAAETLTGFDREDMDTGGKKNGILQYCHTAASGEIHQIGSDEAGIYTKLTGQTVFADGTALADRTLMQYHDTGETEFSYWRAGVLVQETGAKFLQLSATFDGYIGYNAAGELDDTITDVRELIVRTPLVAYMYLNGTSGEITTCPKMYKEGVNGEWRISDDDNKLGIFRSLKCCYNDENGGDWTLSEINSDYVIMMHVATNNKLHPVVALVGQKLHLTRGAARDNAPAEFFRINAAGLPTRELHPLTSMIIHDEVDGQIEVGADGEIYTTCDRGFPVGHF